MFGFSITKLALLILAVVAVWYGFKLLTRLDRARAEGRSPSEEIARNLRRAADRMTAGGSRDKPASDKSSSQDLVWDEKSGSYVPKKEE